LLIISFLIYDIIISQYVNELFILNFPLQTDTNPTDSVS